MPHRCNANFSIHDNPSEGEMREGHGKIPMVRNCLFISIAVHSNVYLIELVSQKSSRLSSEFVSADERVRAGGNVGNLQRHDEES